VDEDDIGSDHKCIKIEFKFNDKKDKFSKRILNIQDAINDINLIDLDRFDNLDNLIASVTNELKKNTKTVHTPFKPKPWWNEQLKKLKDEKMEAIREFNRNANVENIIKVNKLSAEL
jgi:hypothetical protein